MKMDLSMIDISKDAFYSLSSRFYEKITPSVSPLSDGVIWGRLYQYSGRKQYTNN